MSAPDHGDVTDADALTVVDEFDGGAGWLVDPDESLRRASHLLESEAGVWLVDPVDAPGLDAFVEGYGDVAGVVVLLDRHERDAAVIARRHDVAVHTPPGVTRAIDAPREPFVGRLGDTGYLAASIVDLPGWNEYVLSDGETLIVPEAVGTAPYYTVGEEVLGVSPVLRVIPPRGLLEYTPERVLCGHGIGVHEDATAALHDAIASARRNAPRSWGGLLRSMVGEVRR